MSDSIHEALQAVRVAIRALCDAFADPAARKREFSDLSPRFWQSLTMLDDAAYGSIGDLEAAFQATRRQLGAPGDFGYGTPQGDALKQYYDAWAKYGRAKQAAEATAGVASS